MATVAVRPKPQERIPFLPAVVVWQVVLSVYLFLMAFSLLPYSAANAQKTFGDFYDTFLTYLLPFEGLELIDLGEPVQYFVALVVFIPAALTAYSVGLLLPTLSASPPYPQAGRGRYLAMTMNYLVMVLAGAYLLHLWGVFIGIDDIAAALYDNATLLAGFGLAYGLYWVADRFPEGDTRLWVERAGLALAMLTLIGLLLSGGALDAGLHILETYTQLETWLTTVTILICGVVALRMTRMGYEFGETPGQSAAWQGWLMLSPNIIGFMLFFAGPLLLSFYLSFTDSRAVGTPNLIGIENYTDILSLKFRWQDDLDANPQDILTGSGYNELTSFTVGDRRLVIGASDYRFWISLRNTLTFCLMLVPLSIIPALILSIILNSKIPGMRFFRAIYFLPSVAAVVGTALIWRWLYNTNIGYINYAISETVDFINSVTGAALNDPDIHWLTDGDVLLVSIVLLAAWQIIGFNTVLFLAGLQGIPGILYEASFVDGANRWQQFRHVTLPLLAPTTFFVIITTVITGLQVFNEPYALIFVRPMPDAALTSVFYLYNQGFFAFQFGYASAVAWVLFALIFTITLLQFRLQRAGAYDT